MEVLGFLQQSMGDGEESSQNIDLFILTRDHYLELATQHLQLENTKNEVVEKKN